MSERYTPERRYYAAGFAVLEAALLALVCAGLILPLVGVVDLLLARQQLQSISHTLASDNEFKAFRMFSGVESWYTRPINGADERALSTTADTGIRSKTDEYHAILDTIADRAERQAQRILGQQCIDHDCVERYRVEVRVVIPYIVFDTAKLIRITCYDTNAEELIDEEVVPRDRDGCPNGRVNDTSESGTAGSHRFLRVRGSLLRGDSRYIDFLIDDVRSYGQRVDGSTYALAHLATPSGVAGVQHAQQYGISDYVSQHGYNPVTDTQNTRSQMTPNFVRHIFLVGVRVYVDMSGTPGGKTVRMLRELRAVLDDSNENDVDLGSILYTDAFSLARQEF